jgi:hypothetical protein
MAVVIAMNRFNRKADVGDGCERNPIGLIHPAARIRVRGALRDAVPEDDEHPGHLINTSIQRANRKTSSTPRSCARRT